MFNFLLQSDTSLNNFDISSYEILEAYVYESDQTEESGVWQKKYQSLWMVRTSVKQWRAQDFWSRGGIFNICVLAN